MAMPPGTHTGIYRPIYRKFVNRNTYWLDLYKLTLGKTARATSKSCVKYLLKFSVNFYRARQARREPQRGPGTRYCGALSSPPHSVCLEIEIGRKRGERCPLTIRLGVQGSIVSSPSGVRGAPPPAENGFFAYFRSERSHMEHHFQYF